jgi:hypothetical protein
VEIAGKGGIVTKIEKARAALEHLRQTANAGTVNAEDVETLMGYVQESEKAVLGAIDLLQQSRNAFRSKQIERARKMLEELL